MVKKIAQATFQMILLILAIVAVIFGVGYLLVVKGGIQGAISWFLERLKFGG